MGKRLDAAIDEWLLDYKKNSVKVATYSRLRCSYETMLRYPVATKQIDELKTLIFSGTRINWRRADMRYRPSRRNCTC